jgi:gas vesicle protein
MPNTNNNDVQNYSGSNVGSNLAFLLAGCGIGATLALLFAPKSGRELRSDITDITKRGYDETLELAHDLKERSADLYQSVRESADRWYGFAAEKLSLAETTFDEAKQLAQDTGKDISSKATAERPSNIF